VLRLNPAALAGLLPAPLHRLALRLANRVRMVWWRRWRPDIAGVSIIARDGQGRVLLVRQTYGSRAWVLPGGGLDPGEDPALAAAREFREELGCGLSDITLLRVRTEPLHGAHNTVHLFAARLAGEPRPDRREVAEARLFAPDRLPHDISRRMRRRIAELPAADLKDKGR